MATAITTDSPEWYRLALRERGVLEGPNAADNPRVVAYYRDAGFPMIRHDSVPWCAAFVGAMLHRAGVRPSGSLLARSYLAWGRPLAMPRLGCIVVLTRGRSSFLGHVTLWAGPGLGLGGNQSDQVSIARFDPGKVLGYRWPAQREIGNAGSK